MSDYAIIPDGTDSEHEFVFLNKAGAVVPSAESAKYRIVDRDNAVLVDWTSIVPPEPGSIKVPGEINRVRNSRDTVRKITIVVRHNGGENLTGEIRYDLNNYGGIQTPGDLSD